MRTVCPSVRREEDIEPRITDQAEAHQGLRKVWHDVPLGWEVRRVVGYLVVRGANGLEAVRAHRVDLDGWRSTFVMESAVAV